MKTKPGGSVIIFEGLDGAGKTTQLELTRAALQTDGWPVYTTRNLGGTPIGEALREVIKSPLPRPNTTNLYLSVAIQEALVETIDQQRAADQIILMDRGPLSLATYEVYGENLDEGLGWRYVDQGMKHLKPDLIIIYEVEVTTALRRLQQKTGKDDYFESQPTEFFQRVAAGYQEAAKRYQTQTSVIDANQSIELVHAQTMQAIRQLLKT